MYDPLLWGPKIAVGAEPEPKLPEGAKCDNHPGRFAFNLTMAAQVGGPHGETDVYLCRECFLDQRPSAKRHDQKDRRP